MERLSLGAQTLWSYVTSVVDGTHGLVTLVAWNTDVLVLHDVLFDYGLSQGLALRLLDRCLVEFCLRNESTIAWDVVSHLLSANGQLVLLVLLLGRVQGQDVLWVVPVGSNRVSELGLVGAARRGVTYPVHAPQRTVRRVAWAISCLGGHASVGRSPASSSVGDFLVARADVGRVIGDRHGS